MNPLIIYLITIIAAISVTVVLHKLSPFYENMRIDAIKSLSIALCVVTFYFIVLALFMEIY